MNLNILVPLILAVALMSCNKNNDEKPSALTTLTSEDGYTYANSLARWNALKNLNGTSYSYKTTFTSWTGNGNVTELTIKEGVVVSRVYSEIKMDDTSGQQEITEIFSETITNVGSHDKGASPLTIDDLYNSCASEYLSVDTENNTLFFETELDGLMTLCGFVPDGCMDDCFIGVSINSFRWLN